MKEGDSKSEFRMVTGILVKSDLSKLKGQQTQETFDHLFKKANK